MSPDLGRGGRHPWRTPHAHRQPTELRPDWRVLLGAGIAYAVVLWAGYSWLWIVVGGK